MANLVQVDHGFISMALHAVSTQRPKLPLGHHLEKQMEHKHYAGAR